jgi:hypothetical protein
MITAEQHERGSKEPLLRLLAVRRCTCHTLRCVNTKWVSPSIYRIFPTHPSNHWDMLTTLFISMLPTTPTISPPLAPFSSPPPSTGKPPDYFHFSFFLLVMPRISFSTLPSRASGLAGRHWEAGPGCLPKICRALTEDTSKKVKNHRRTYSSPEGCCFPIFTAQDPRPLSEATPRLHHSTVSCLAVERKEEGKRPPDQKPVSISKVRVEFRSGSTRNSPILSHTQMGLHRHSNYDVYLTLRYASAESPDRGTAEPEWETARPRRAQSVMQTA